MDTAVYWHNVGKSYMIIMILCSGLSHYKLHTLFLQSSLTQIIPRLHIDIHAKLELPPQYAYEDDHGTITYKLEFDHFL